MTAIAARGYPMAGKTVALTGASGAYGQAITRMVEARGGQVLPLKYGKDWTDEDFSGADDVLSRADLLVLAHGAKEDAAMAANADAFVVFVERYRALRAGEGTPEVWAVGSEIEFHPAFGAEKYAASKRAYARVARWLYKDDSILYRHIVPAAFESDMGPGFISADTAVRWTMWWIDRGYHYVPVTYAGFAFPNAVRFWFGWNKQTPQAFLGERGKAALAEVTSAAG